MPKSNGYRLLFSLFAMSESQRSKSLALLSILPTKDPVDVQCIQHKMQYLLIENNGPTRLL